MDCGVVFLTLVVVAMWCRGRYLVNFHFSCHLVCGTHTVDAQVDATLVFALKKFTQMSTHFHFHMWRICSPTIGVIFTIIISRTASASISKKPWNKFSSFPSGSAEANIWRQSNSKFYFFFQKWMNKCKLCFRSAPSMYFCAEV